MIQLPDFLIFHFVTDAMNNYDEWVVEQKQAKGKKLKRSEMNCPENYSDESFENPNSDGDTEKDGANRKIKRSSLG